MKHRPHYAQPYKGTAKRTEDPERSGTLQKIIAIVISGLILIAVGFLGYILYDQFVVSSETIGQEEAPEEFVPLTHDELLGRPLSFETPAFLRIPSIDLNQEIREGSDDEEELRLILSMGPVHVTHTGYPGWSGNCVIQGHQSSKTKPFDRLNELKTGNSIFIDNPRGTYEYITQDFSYIDPEKNYTLQTADPILTLATRAPEGDVPERLIVKATLINYVPIEEMQ
ncbi:MAG: hypothetical protein A2W01_01635 [Candidatus Solincola sediminis]|uniref:Sortase n=1 Tax=Candidatus Solincola sediminis TaxID=1797199 RepID=A0A1F2WKB8_9ACTN|nr:MAG: hypothetical protein A2Y75_07675 [Candidatus Solincola sediminis]OFW58805.1 MAG: hypothetical protein A2W01_01635 [Candidatus Solincola sediminis]